MGLTGGIGAGKSAALAAFAACGAATLSADDAVHRAYDDPKLRAHLVERFGAEVVDADGALDRRLLGARAFAQPDGIRFLEGLVHPRVQAGRREWTAAERARVPPPPLLVCEVPLLYEVGAAGGFDAVLVVTASEDVRRRRVEARGQDYAGLSARQLPEEEKRRRADHAFVNDGTLAELERWAAARFLEYAGAPCRGRGLAR